MNRVRALESEIKGARHFEALIREENRIAFALTELSALRERAGGAFQVPPIRSEAQYDAYVLVPQFVQLYAAGSDTARHALVRRMHGAIRNPDDMRAIQAEWVVAVHLQRQGFHIEFPEMTGSGTFDLLAQRNGIELEAECKSISGDKGNPIHRREAGGAQAALRADIEPIAKNLNAGLLVRIIARGRVPKSPAGVTALCEQVKHAILSATPAATPDLEVRLQDFAIAGSPFVSANVDEGSVHAFVERLGATNKDLMVFYSPGKRAMILTLESEKPSRLVASVIDTVKDACDRQLTGTRAGAVFIMLEGLTAAELQEVGEEQGEATPLRRATSRFLDKRRHSHLMCLAYLANAPLMRGVDGSITRGGSSYFFENPESPFYSRGTVAALGGLVRQP